MRSQHTVQVVLHFFRYLQDLLPAMTTLIKFVTRFTHSTVGTQRDRPVEIINWVCLHRD